MSQTSDLSTAAKRHANDLAAQAKDTIEQEAVAHADTVKIAAADNVQSAADAATAAAGELDPSSPQAQAIQQVADQIEEVAATLRHADVRQLATQTTEVARQNPLLFIGGAALLGFAAARFLKARDPKPISTTFKADPWAEPAGSAHTHNSAGGFSNG